MSQALFNEYYRDVSACVPDDAFFEALLEGCWPAATRVLQGGGISTARDAITRAPGAADSRARGPPSIFEDFTVSKGSGLDSATAAAALRKRLSAVSDLGAFSLLLPPRNPSYVPSYPSPSPLPAAIAHLFFSLLHVDADADGLVSDDEFRGALRGTIGICIDVDGSVAGTRVGTVAAAVGAVARPSAIDASGQRVTLGGPHSPDRADGRRRMHAGQSPDFQRTGGVVGRIDDIGSGRGVGSSAPLVVKVAVENPFYVPDADAHAVFAAFAKSRGFSPDESVPLVDLFRTICGPESAAPARAAVISSLWSELDVKKLGAIPVATLLNAFRANELPAVAGGRYSTAHAFRVFNESVRLGALHRARQSPVLSYPTLPARSFISSLVRRFHSLTQGAPPAACAEAPPRRRIQASVTAPCGLPSSSTGIEASPRAAQTTPRLPSSRTACGRRTARVESAEAARARRTERRASSAASLSWECVTLPPPPLHSASCNCLRSLLTPALTPPASCQGAHAHKGIRGAISIEVEGMSASMKGLLPGPASRATHAAARGGGLATLTSTTGAAVGAAPGTPSAQQQQPGGFEDPRFATGMSGHALAANAPSVGYARRATGAHAEGFFAAAAGGAEDGGVSAPPPPPAAPLARPLSPAVTSVVRKALLAGGPRASLSLARALEVASAACAAPSSSAAPPMPRGARRHLAHAIPVSAVIACLRDVGAILDARGVAALSDVAAQDYSSSARGSAPALLLSPLSFLLAVHPALPPARAAVIERAFAHVRASVAREAATANAGQGRSAVATLTDAHMLFQSAAHPDVRAGKRADEDVLREFLEFFSGPTFGGERGAPLSLDGFSAYYTLLSLHTESDAAFAAILFDTWGLGFAATVSQGPHAPGAGARVGSSHQPQPVALPSAPDVSVSSLIGGSAPMYRYGPRGPGPEGLPAAAYSVNGRGDDFTTRAAAQRERQGWGLERY